MLQWCKEWGRSMLYVYSLLSFSFQRRCDANVISTSIYRSSTTTPLRWLRSCDDDQQLSYDDSSVVIVLTTTSHGVVIRASRRRTAVIRVSATLMRRRHGCRLPETRARERERERERESEKCECWEIDFNYNRSAARWLTSYRPRRRHSNYVTRRKMLMTLAAEVAVSTDDEIAQRPWCFLVVQLSWCTDAR